MIRVTRAVFCDAPDCPNVSINVLATVDVADGQLPDWQGWQIATLDMSGGEPFQVKEVHHLCPDCVKAGVRIGGGSA